MWRARRLDGRWGWLWAGVAAGSLACAPPEDSTSGLPGLVTQFHGGPEKLGWVDDAELAPSDVAAGLTGSWSTPRLDAVTIDGVVYPPRIYASPLLANGRLYTATSNGWVYAIETADGPEQGTIAWSTSVVTPGVVDRLDGGVPLGVLSTPVIDVQAGALYVVGLDATAGWQAIALDLDTGVVRSGWPVSLDAATIEARNLNGPTPFLNAEQMSQRGALALSPTGISLYVPFGTFWGEGAGWMVELQTRVPAVNSSFASSPQTQSAGSGGIWGAAGPTVLPSGDVLAATGNAPAGSESTPGVWGSSLLRFSPDLRTVRSYTPFNYCVLDEFNMDLGASQALLLQGTSLAALGGKQGTVYLVDVDTLPPAGAARPECRTQADTDASLLPPGVQPQYGTRGPLSVFGPYSDVFGEIDNAKMRTRLAYFEDAQGPVLFASGSSKETEASTRSVPPSVARLRVNTDGPAPYLSVDRVNSEVAMLNPGSPVVSSSGPHSAVVWVLDRNALRTAPLLDPATPQPVLYAFDGESLALLWKSPPGLLGPSGKYTTALVAGAHVVVATDRVQAFTLAPPAR